MATAVQFRRGNTSDHSSFTGLEGEITVDTDKNTVVVHDGSTAGGIPLAKASEVSSVATQITTADESSDAECFPVFTTAATGDLAPKTDTAFKYNATNGTVTATTFVGALTGHAQSAGQVTHATSAGGTHFLSMVSANSATPLIPHTKSNLTYDRDNDILSVNGTVTADRFTGSQTPNIQSGNETMSGHVGEKTICVGATGTVTYTFPDVADGDKGDTWTVVNASDQSITCARSSDTQFSKLVAGSNPASATSVTISKGGVAEFVVTAANVITVFGSGIS